MLVDAVPTCTHGCLHVAVNHGHAVERLRSLAPMLFSGSCCSCYRVEDNRPCGASGYTGIPTTKQTHE